MSTIPRLIAGRSDEKDVFAIVNALVDGLAVSPVTPSPTGGRVFVETATGVGPWDFTGLDGDEAGLIGYELELAIVDPTNNICMRINGDAGANYGDLVGVPLNQATVGPALGGSPTGVRGVVELRGVAAGSIRTIGCGRITPFEATSPSVSSAGDSCYIGTAALTAVSLFQLAGAAGAASSVTLFKVMSGA